MILSFWGPPPITLCLTSFSSLEKHLVKKKRERKKEAALLFVSTRKLYHQPLFFLTFLRGQKYLIDGVRHIYLPAAKKKEAWEKKKSVNFTFLSIWANKLTTMRKKKGFDRLKFSVLLFGGLKLIYQVRTCALHRSDRYVFSRFLLSRPLNCLFHLLFFFQAFNWIFDAINGWKLWRQRFGNARNS